MDKSKLLYETVKKKIGNIQPVFGLILGSGLGYLVDEVEDPLVIPTSNLAGYPQSTVEGHQGNLVIGKLHQVPVLIFQGRIHYYEGYSIQEVTTPISIVHHLGIQKLIVTNSAGGLNPVFQPGDLMLITDHINLMFQNPLIGPVPKDEIRFPDMSQPYDPVFMEIAKEVAEEKGILLHAGVYVGVTGPTYETKSEVRFLRKIGADAAGMSTVPEVIAAVQKGIRVLGVSCISNLATGMSPAPLSHEEVKATANKIKYTFGSLIKGIIEKGAHA
jgi:purine-nucleoside phosphorylase